MNRSFTNSTLPVLALLVGVVVSLGFNPASTAVRKVRKGIRFFVGGEFESAGKAFSEADKAEPDNATIVFDRACALAASGDSEKVEEAQKLFRNAALARDVGLAARAQYNLGCLSAEQGRATLGENPVEAAPEKREEGVSLLLAAVGHYRDCLRLDKEHGDARHNLELIRLFIKHIQDQWAKRDREQAREEKVLHKV
jgi:tetratricopeptide (TPR) repeat protein